MKKLTAICISLILVLASAVTCFGDGLYEVDAQSGQIVGAQYGSDEETVNYVRISPNCAYDKTTRMYVYTGMGSSGTTFSCSIVNGMYTRDRVELLADPTAQLSIYRNGELLEYSGDGSFKDSGVYIVRDKENSMVFSFTILAAVTGSVSSYEVPAIFFVDSVMLDGEEQRLNGNSIALNEDGEYDIHYFCYETGLNYKLNVIIDHTAPVLAIEGVNEEGYAQHPVTLGGLEKYSTIDIKVNGSEIEYAESMTETGDYRIEYTDEAGNTSTYSFTIRPYLDLNAWMALLVIVLLLIGTAAFMIYNRTHMRVR